MALFRHVVDAVIEETFMNGLLPWVKAEVECWQPIGLAKRIIIAKYVENHELTCWKLLIAQQRPKTLTFKVTLPNARKEITKPIENMPMRIIICLLY